MKIAKVMWVDACTFDTKDKAMARCPIRHSIGYVLRDDEDAIALCHLYDKETFGCVDNNDESEGILIPKGMVLDIKYLK